MSSRVWILRCRLLKPLDLKLIQVTSVGEWHCIQGLPYPVIATNLNVHPTTVSRTVKLFEETGTVCSIQGYCKNHHHTLKLLDKYALLNTIVDEPAHYLSEIQQILRNTTGTQISVPTISKYLHKAGFTHKKLMYRAGQRNEALRQQFMSQVEVYDPRMLVFIDECGSDRKSALRRYGQHTFHLQSDTIYRK